MFRFKCYELNCISIPDNKVGAIIWNSFLKQFINIINGTIHQYHNTLYTQSSIGDEGVQLVFVWAPSTLM